MSALPEFSAFKSIPRLRRDVVVTEKLDGTNAQVHVTESGEVIAGSRSRWITPEADNYGFAAWVQSNAEQLRALGPGSHFGEWWGAGIQRRYGLPDKRFSLFNVSRWSDEAGLRPACCGVVPVLYSGVFDMGEIDRVVGNLSSHGSVAAPGFMKPEGVVVYHIAANQLFKFTLDGNDGHKGHAYDRKAAPSPLASGVV